MSASVATRVRFSWYLPSVQQARIWAVIFSKFLLGQGVIQLLTFASGLLIVRSMDKARYAQYTLAVSGLHFLAILSDLGLSSGVVALGGRFYQDAERLDRIVRCVLRYRKRLLAVGGTVFLIVFPPVARAQGAGAAGAWVLSVLVLVCCWLQASALIYGGVLKLHGRITSVQTNEAVGGGLRLVMLGAACAIGLDPFWALAATAAGFAIQSVANRTKAAPFTRHSQDRDEEERVLLRRFVMPLLAPTMFYAVQGQVTLWLAAAFATTSAVADLGALSRLSQLFVVMTVMNSTLVQPHFARIQDEAVMRTRVLQTIAVASAGVALVLLSAYAVPGIWLGLLGNRYAGLNAELLGLIAATATAQYSSLCYTILIARRRTAHQWWTLPLTIGGVIVGLCLSPPTSTLNAVHLELYRQIPPALLQVGLLVHLVTRRSAAIEPAAHAPAMN